MDFRRPILLKETKNVQIFLEFCVKKYTKTNQIQLIDF